MRKKVCPLHAIIPHKDVTLTTTMKITLLPDNTCSIFSNDITLTCHIQNTINCICREKYMAKGTRSKNLCIPISFEKYLYEGAIGTGRVRVQRPQLSFHQLCFTYYCYFAKWGKLLLFLATIIREKNQGDWCVKSMKFVLSMFRESLLALTHAYMLAISSLISEMISFRLYPVPKIFV